MPEHQNYFVVVGSMKAGTASLVKLINDNFHVCLPNSDVNYFDDDNINHSEKGFLFTLRNLTKVQSNNVDAYGDKTTMYSYKAECAARIKDVLKNPKLIWILRDPVLRTFSHYNHKKKQGLESRPFQEVVNSYISGNQEEIIDRSVYSRQVKRYLEYFGKEDILFIDFDTLISHPKDVLQRFANFLGLETKSEIYNLNNAHQNETRLPIFPLLERLASKFGRTSIPYRIFHKLNSIQNVSSMCQETRESLEVIFKEETNFMKQLIDV